MLDQVASTKLADVDFQAILEGTEYEAKAPEIQSFVSRRCKTWRDLQDAPGLFGAKVLGFSTYSLIYELNQRIQAYLDRPAEEPTPEKVEPAPKPKGTSKKSAAKKQE